MRLVSKACLGSSQSCLYDSTNEADVHVPASAVQSTARCLPFGLEGSPDRRGGPPVVGLSYYVTPPDLDC